MQEDEVIESKFVSKTIERAQEKVEKQNFEIRKHLIEYDDVLNQQRIVVYEYRRDVLEGEERIYELIRDFIIRVVQDVIAFHCPKRTITADQVKEVFEEFSRVTGIKLQEFEQAGFGLANIDQFKKDLNNFLLSRYHLYRNQQNKDVVQQAEKWLMLETIDQAWKQHMLNLDHLKEGIGLRGWGQKNPLIEYKREAFDMFREMLELIRKDIVRHIFHLNLERFDEREFEQRREKELDELNMISGEVAAEGEAGAPPPEKRAGPKVGRNDPCPCGSGKKYKKCCGK